jgi:hypothetical protein
MIRVIIKKNKKEMFRMTKRVGFKVLEKIEVPQKDGIVANYVVVGFTKNKLFVLDTNDGEEYTYKDKNRMFQYMKKQPNFRKNGPVMVNPKILQKYDILPLSKKMQIKQLPKEAFKHIVINHMKRSWKGTKFTIGKVEKIVEVVAYYHETDESYKMTCIQFDYKIPKYKAILLIFLKKIYY